MKEKGKGKGDVLACFYFAPFVFVFSEVGGGERQDDGRFTVVQGGWDLIRYS